MSDFLRLKQLATLAGMKADRSRAALAQKMRPVREIESKLTALDHGLQCQIPDDFEALVAMSRHQKWQSHEKRRLQSLLAMAMAEAQPIKERAQRDAGRADVLDQLLDRECCDREKQAIKNGH